MTVGGGAHREEAARRAGGRRDLHRRTGGEQALRQAAGHAAALGQETRSSGSTVYSDEAPAYEGMPEYRHRSVNYSKGRDFPSRYPSIVEDFVVMPDGRDEQTD